jgi:branched-chain amino acid transport system permease protein
VSAAAVAPGPGLRRLAICGVLGLLLLLAPVIFSDFFISVILTKALWLAIAAASLIFLAGYGGMVSLGQVGLYGVAGFTMANLVAADGGSPIAIDPWLGAIGGIATAVLIGFAFGAIACRAEGIYFLMITLAFSVIVYYFWGQVTQLSGFGGVNRVDLPPLIGNPVTDGTPLYYVALVASAAVFAGLLYLSRTPFGLTLQGVRDDPTRMRALGYHVALHRTLAFTVGALVAGIAGILSVWYNTRISPGSISLAQTIDVLVIAVIGGLYRLEGAWIGALVFALIDNYSRDYTPHIGSILGPDRFNTLIGIVFLIIVLLSPGGIVGIWSDLQARRHGRRPAPGAPSATTLPPTSTSAAAGKPGVP